MGERPFKIVEIGYLHILLAGHLVSVMCINTGSPTMSYD